MQEEITIRMVLPVGVSAPDLDASGPRSISGLAGGMAYMLYPDCAQDIQIDIEVAPSPVTDHALWADVAFPVMAWASTQPDVMAWASTQPDVR